MPRRLRFTRITGTLSGVQEDESEDLDPAQVPLPLPDSRGSRVDRADYLPGTFDPLSDPLDDPFPEELR